MLTPNLSIPTHSTASFTYVPAENMFVTEASDLGPRYASRCFDDACDVGFQLRSTRTGRVVLFTLAGGHWDAEGELVYEDYRPADTQLWAAGTVRIFND